MGETGNVKERRGSTDTSTNETGERPMTLREAGRRAREVLKAVLMLAPGLLVLWGIATLATGDRPVLGALITIGYFVVCCGIGFGYSRSRAGARAMPAPDEARPSRRLSVVR
jgi:hypothetical protein